MRQYCSCEWNDLVNVISLCAAHQAFESQRCAGLAQWMLTNDFATGHGDTFEELLKELTWQIDELREKRFEEALRRGDGGVR